jgi:hypothetical protein
MDTVVAGRKQFKVEDLNFIVCKLKSVNENINNSIVMMEKM